MLPAKLPAMSSVSPVFDNFINPMEPITYANIKNFINVGLFIERCHYYINGASTGPVWCNTCPDCGHVLLAGDPQLEQHREFYEFYPVSCRHKLFAKLTIGKNIFLYWFDKKDRSYKLFYYQPKGQDPVVLFDPFIRTKPHYEESIQKTLHEFKICEWEIKKTGKGKCYRDMIQKDHYDRDIIACAYKYPFWSDKYNVAKRVGIKWLGENVPYGNCSVYQLTGCEYIDPHINRRISILFNN